MRKVFRLIILVICIFTLAFTAPAYSRAAWQNDAKPSVVFILSNSMKDARLAEFYDLLQPEEKDINMSIFYTDDLNTLTDNSTVISKLSSAEEVFIVGVPMKTDRDSMNEDWLKYPALDQLKKNSTTAKWYYVYTLSSTSSFDWRNLSCNHTEINLISSTYPWLTMYSNNLFDKYKDLGLNSWAVKPTTVAGYGLAVYMQYVLNGNTCAGLSYSMLLEKMNIAAPVSTVDEKCETARKMITKELSPNNSLLNVKTIDVQKMEASAEVTYKEDHYRVFDDMYIIDSGIYKLNQESDGNPICFDGGYGGSIMERVWHENRWIHNTYSIHQSKAASDYTEGDAITIEKDSSGNFYVGKTINDRYYIYKYNAKHKLEKTICINNLTRSSCNKFYLLKKDQVLVQTTLPADQYSADTGYTYNGLKCYDNLFLVNMNNGKIIRKYDTGLNYGNIEIKNQKIYMVNSKAEKLLIINGTTGNVEKIINIKDFSIINEKNSYSEELGTDRSYYYSVYKNHIYFQKKSGVYKLSTDDGSWSKIISGKQFQFFKIQDMRATDFVVKNDKEMYILAVFFDEECSTDFYKYSIK